MKKGSQKIWFLQLVRMLACSLVVYVHWFGLITSPNAIHEMILQDAIPNYPKVQLTDYVYAVISFFGLKNLVAGYFSLGLFFLLSGYVIPMSLKNATPFSYLVRRLLRIYPTLFVCLIIAASTMTIANYYTESTASINFFSPGILFTNLLLLRDVLHQPHIERAMWTLEIELHFYLVFFLFFYFSWEKKIKTFIYCSATMLVTGEFIVIVSGYFDGEAHRLVNGMGNLICLNSSYISFMFVATALYYTFSQRWSLPRGLLASLVLLLLNYLCLHSGTINQGHADLIFINHLYALAFFLILYFLNNYLPQSKWIGHMADISYPFYLLHGFTGFTIYFVCFIVTRNVLFSALFSFAIILLLANLIHFTVEKPSIRFAKELLDKKDLASEYPFRGNA